VQLRVSWKSHSEMQTYITSGHKWICIWSVHPTFIVRFGWNSVQEIYEQSFRSIFMFVPCINDNWTLHYPTNAQYIICRYNQNYKIFKSAPTCFGSQRIHHQRALYCASLKITRMVPSCPLTRTRSMLWQHNFSQALYKAPWWRILCDLKHVGTLLNIL